MADQRNRGRRQEAQPSQEEWERNKPRILELYKGRTCPEVAEIMKLEGFVATHRMFKSRFGKWGIDTKTIKRPEYELMLRIYEEREKLGQLVEFSVPRGMGRKTVTISDIRKATARGKNDEARRMHRKDMEQQDTAAIMGRLDIRVIPAGSAASDASSSSSSESAPSSPNIQLSSRPDHWTEQYGPQDDGAVLLEDLDVTPLFVSMSMEDPVCPSPGYSPWARTSNTAQAQDSQAQEWLFHVFKTSMMTDRNLSESAARHRMRARHYFEHLLRNSNYRLVTSLFHISMTLSTLGQDQIYHNFLEDCCEVIEAVKSERSQRDLRFLTPYQYAWACEKNDQGAIKKHSESLQHCVDYCSASGDGSPSALMLMHFQASHLLGQAKDIPAAILLLKSCLAQSDNVLDRNNLINVNCLALLARAYTMQGDSQEAMSLYSDAAERCQQRLGVRHPYRLKLLRELAVLQAASGQVDVAEHHLRFVLAGRADMLGSGHGDTWGSLQDLRSLLCHRGRAGEWQQLQDSLRMTYWEASEKFIVPDEAYGLWSHQSAFHQ